MDKLDQIIESSIYKVTRLYLGEQAEAPQEEPPADDQESPEPPTGVGLDATGQQDPMGAQGIPGPAAQQPPDPEIKELDVDDVAPNPKKIDPPPVDSDD